MAELLAGAARREITTTDPRTAVHDPLWVKALYLQNGDRKLLFFSMDTICLGGGIGDLSDDFVPNLQKALADCFVIVGTTHTHTPDRMLREESLVLEAALEAAREAQARAVPARFGVTGTRCDSFALNRSVTLTDGSRWSVRQAHPAPPDKKVDHVEDALALVDVLKVEGLDGTPVAALFCFGCHPLVGYADNSVTANYPGIAERLVEKLWGGVAMLFQSTGGDVTERDYKQYDRPKDCTQWGNALGLAVLEAIRDCSCDASDFETAVTRRMFPRRRDIPGIREKLLAEQETLLAGLSNSPLNFKTFLPLYLKYLNDPEHPLENAALYDWEARNARHDLVDQDRINRKNIGKYLANLEALDRLVWIRSALETYAWHEAYNAGFDNADLEAQICGVRLGDCVLLTAPVEMLTGVGEKLRARSAFRHTLICSYANGYMHYGAPATAYADGSYETIECFLDAGWEALYLDAAEELLSRLQLDPA